MTRLIPSEDELHAYVEVDFRKPVRLPSEVVLSASEAGPAGVLRLDGHGGLLHMLGQWRPLAPL